MDISSTPATDGAPGPRRALRRAALVVCAALASGPVARAQPSPPDLAIAEALFQEGRRLMSEGQARQACPKLADSLRIAPGGGTELALAQCYEEVGRTSSAWMLYTQSITTSRRNGRADREKLARERIEALEPRLSRLILRVAPASEGLAGLEVRANGSLVPASAFGVALPVDPGPQLIVATATGRRPWSITIQVRPDADRHSLEIPALELLPASPPASASSPAPASSASAPGAPASVVSPAPVVPASRGPLYVAAGTAVVGLSAGTILLLLARSLHEQSAEVCPASPCSDRQAVDDSRRARSLANGATIGLGVGLAGLAVGGYLWLSEAPRPAGSARTPRPPGRQNATGQTWATPWVGAGQGGLAVNHRW